MGLGRVHVPVQVLIYGVNISDVGAIVGGVGGHDARAASQAAVRMPGMACATVEVDVRRVSADTVG